MNVAIQQSEHFWINLYHQGDERALLHFFEKHYQPLCYFAKRLIHDEEEAKDIVSGCFIKLWNAEHKAQTSGNIKSFLYISCKNACFNYLDTLKSRTKHQTEYYHQLAKEDDQILYKIIQSEVLAILALEIELLPEKCKEVFKLYYFENKKTADIAVALSTNEKSVRYYKAKSIDYLKSAMLKKGLTDNIYLLGVLFLGKS